MGQWEISEGLIQHCFWCPGNLKGNFHNVQSPWCPAFEGQGCPRIPCSRNPLGGTNLDFQKEWCIYERKSDGLCIINMKTTWQKLLLVARAIVASEIPADVIVISSRNTGQWAVLKIAAVTRSTPIAGDLTPGTELDPGSLLGAGTSRGYWFQGWGSASHRGVLCLPACHCSNTDSHLHCVHIATPCNNKGAHPEDLLWWMLSWEVLCIYSTASCEHAWEVLSDLYFYRDPEKIEKEEQTTAEKVVTKDEFQG